MIHMKTKLLLTLFALTALTMSCGKTNPEGEPTPDDKDKTSFSLSAPVLEASAQSVALEYDKASDIALSLSWTSALDAADTATAEYDLYANVTSKDIFTDPYSRSLGNVLTVALTGTDLVAILRQLGAEGPTEVQFAVYAKSDKYDGKVSNKVTVNVTPYEEPLKAPAALYMVGVATRYGWDLTTALALPKDASANIYRAVDEPLTVLPVSLNAGMKFYFSRAQNEDDDPRFLGQDPASDTFGDAIIVEDGKGDFQFLPAISGYDNGLYDITVDLDNLKLTLKRKGDLPKEPLPDKLYLLGNCVEWLWEFTGPTLDKVSGSVYEMKDVNMRFGDDANPLGFKVFLAVGKWSPYYAQADGSTLGNVGIALIEDSETPQFYPGKLGYTDGVYDIKMDFDAMKATFTRKGDIPTPSGLEKIYLLGDSVTWKWSFASAKTLDRTAPNIYNASDINFYWGDNNDCGFKLFMQKDNWNDWYGMDPASPAGEIHIVNGGEYAAEHGGDPQVYPGKQGFSHGTYDLELNLSTMRLTLTKK